MRMAAACASAAEIPLTRNLVFSRECVQKFIHVEEA